MELNSESHSSQSDNGRPSPPRSPADILAGVLVCCTNGNENYAVWERTRFEWESPQPAPER